MDDLNFHHLYYFWLVAKEGTIAAACERVGLTQPTLSTQLKKLEQSLQRSLFRKAGRRLELTETGRRVFRYADEIFAKGQELVDDLKGRSTGQPQRLAIGISYGLSTLWTQRCLRNLLALPQSFQMTCRSGLLFNLVADLAIDQLDLVLTETVPTANPHLRVHAHLVEECVTTFLGVETFAEHYRRSFPRTLNDAPLILPTAGHVLRQAFDAWCREHQVSPRIVAEYDDLALLMEMGMAGQGLFPVPAAVTDDLLARAGVSTVGQLPALPQQLWAITCERRPKHPGVLALLQTAQPME
ncbi:LysR family transcriptional regulator [bacterium]|nr:LysR family transcriptional regulator [bacterium]